MMGTLAVKGLERHSEIAYFTEYCFIKNQSKTCGNLCGYMISTNWSG